jgi:hypothetical protein
MFFFGLHLPAKAGLKKVLQAWTNMKSRSQGAQGKQALTCGFAWLHPFFSFFSD